MALVALTYDPAVARITLRIITPPEHASVLSQSVQLVGRTGASEVSIMVNGALIAKIEVEDSVFHRIVKFGYGLNEIVVSAMILSDSGDYLVSDTIETLYSPRSMSVYKAFFPEFVFHGSSAEGDCDRCHVSEFDSRELIESGADEEDQAGCLVCHVDMKDSFRRHIKSDDDMCVICHTRGEGLERARSRDNNLCFTCHPERRGMFSKEYVHGPVAAGSCLCHDPHGSQFEKNLISPVQILCVSCHSEMEEEFAKEVVHHPFEHGDCVACHDPHATNNKWVLVKNSQEVCMTCHNPEETEFDHNHPYNVRPRNKLRIPLKLTSRGQLECISCHAPHASSTKHLLRTTSEFTCIGCHEEKM